MEQLNPLESRASVQSSPTEPAAPSDLNHILTWGKDAISSDTATTEADILTFEQYQESNVRKQGHRKGMAQRAPTNKQHCQAAYVASALSDLVANKAYGGTEVEVDDWKYPVEKLTFDLFKKLKKISDVAVNENKDVVHITKTETITGEKTFVIPPNISAGPTANDDATNKEYVDAEVKKVSDKLLTFNDIYPVGSIYLSLSETFDPNVAFNQSFVSQKSVWKRLENKFLLGASAQHPFNESKGSETASLTVENLPPHNHSGTAQSAGSHTHSGTARSSGGHSHNAGTLGTELVGEIKSTGGAGSNFLTEAGVSASGVYELIIAPNASSSDDGVYGNGTRGWKFNGAGKMGGSTAQSGAHTHDLSIDSAGTHSHNVTTENVGGNQSFSIMPPYLSVNMWQRIS